MEEEAPSPRSVSVAELAGRFKGSAPAHDAARNETEKPVRRRPPRSLQLPKAHADDQEPPPVTSPLPGKAKRNSALIEKLQANLALSPSALLPSPKSPGFRLLPPSFTPPSPGSAPGTTSATPTPSSPCAASPLTEEEKPASFEAPPTAVEGSVLPCINKSRARHSIRRRPPSRRHRKSSSGEDVGDAKEGEDASPSEVEDKTTEHGGGDAGGEGGGEGGGEDAFKEDSETQEPKDKPEGLLTNGSHEDEESKCHNDLQKEEGEKEEEEDGANAEVAKAVKTEEEDQSECSTDLKEEDKEKDREKGGEEGKTDGEERSETKQKEEQTSEKEEEKDATCES